MGAVSLSFIIGMSTIPADASFVNRKLDTMKSSIKDSISGSAYLRFTAKACGNDPVLALKSLDVSPQLNCIKAAYNALQGLHSGKASQNFIHMMNVAKETSPDIAITLERLFELALKNIKAKVPFKEWGTTYDEIGNVGTAFVTLKEMADQAFGIKAEGTNRQLIQEKTRHISTLDCKTRLDLAIESALSSSPNKAGMEAAMIELGRGKANSSLKFIFSIMSHNEQEVLRNLFAVRAGKESVSGADLTKLLNQTHEIAIKYESFLNLYKLMGTFTRQTCPQNLYTALKAILYPTYNPNCWKAIDRALKFNNGPLTESLGSVAEKVQESFKAVLTARINGASSTFENMETLVDFLEQVKGSKDKPNAAVPFKTSGFAERVMAHVGLSRSACAASVEKWIQALMLESIQKQCILGGWDSAESRDTKVKENSTFYNGYRGSKDSVNDQGEHMPNMAPGWHDFEESEQAIILKLAKVRLGQLTVTPQEKVMLVGAVAKALGEAKARAFLRYVREIEANHPPTHELPIDKSGPHHDTTSGQMPNKAHVGTQGAYVGTLDSGTSIVDQMIKNLYKKLDTATDAEKKVIAAEISGLEQVLKTLKTHNRINRGQQQAQGIATQSAPTVHATHVQHIGHKEVTAAAPSSSVNEVNRDIPEETA